MDSDVYAKDMKLGLRFYIGYNYWPSSSHFKKNSTFIRKQRAYAWKQVKTRKATDIPFDEVRNVANHQIQMMLAKAQTASNYERAGAYEKQQGRNVADC